MKTYRIFGLMLVTGTPEELDRVDKLTDESYMDKLSKLIAGTHHIAKNPGETRKRNKSERDILEDINSNAASNVR